MNGRVNLPILLVGFCESLRAARQFVTPADCVTADVQQNVTFFFFYIIFFDKNNLHFLF